MKYDFPDNCDCDAACCKKGFQTVPETKELDDTPTNQMWPEDVGGFLPRPNGWER